jgi:hypothetical protein
MLGIRDDRMLSALTAAMPFALLVGPIMDNLFVLNLISGDKTLSDVFRQILDGQNVLTALCHNLLGNGTLHPIASIVTRHPLMSRAANTCGSAVISLDLSATATCAKMSRWAVAQALTKCKAGVP